MATPHAARSGPSPLDRARPAAARHLPDEQGPREPRQPERHQRSCAANAGNDPKHHQPYPGHSGQDKPVAQVRPADRSHGRAGPTPSRNRSAAKNGALTRSNHGAPTLNRSPPRASTTRGYSVPNRTANASPVKRRLFSRNADSRLTAGGGRRRQVRQAPEDERCADHQRHQDGAEEPCPDRRLGKRMD